MDADVNPIPRYSLFNEAHLFALQQRERTLLLLLRSAGIISLAGKRILEVGCGHRGWFMDLMKYEASINDLFGVELSLHRLATLQHVAGGIRVVAADARALPWPDASFDIVIQSTMFSSVLAAEARKQIAAEMRRVLRPGGIIIWYDMRVNSPANPTVRRIGRNELRALFPGCKFHLRRVTLAMPLARALVPFSWDLCRCLELIPALRTHYLVLIREQRS